MIFVAATCMPNVFFDVSLHGSSFPFYIPVVRGQGSGVGKRTSTVAPASTSSHLSSTVNPALLRRVAHIAEPLSSPLLHETRRSIPFVEN